MVHCFHVARDDVAARINERIGGFGLAHGHRPLAGEHHLHHHLRVGLAGAEQHRVDVAQHGGDRLGGNEADLVGRGRQAGCDAIDVVRLVEVAEIAPRVQGVLVLRPQRRGVAEQDGGELLGRVHHEGVEVAEGGGEYQIGAVQIDHRLHGFGDGNGLRHILFLDHLDARDRLQGFRGHGMGLVPSEVVARPDINEPDNHVLGESPPRQSACDQPSRSASQHGAARQVVQLHKWLPIADDTMQVRAAQPAA